MPMLLAGWRPDHVAGTDLLCRLPPGLNPAAAGGDDQGLAQRMGVPGAAGAGLEGDVSAAGARGVARRKQRIDAHLSGEVVGRTFVGRTLAVASDLHGRLRSLF